MQCVRAKTELFDGLSSLPTTEEKRRNDELVSNIFKIAYCEQIWRDIK